MDCKVISDYVITPVVLGKGSFGTVYRGYMKNNKNHLLAVKAIPLASIKNQTIIKREIDIMMKLNNPNIVRFYKPARTKNHLYFFLQYCQQDLKKYLASKQGKLSELQVRTILKQICNGFKDLHEKNIIHRDIKPANFLIHKGVVKIADFGFARVVESVDETAKHTVLGSPLYMAPQLLDKKEFNSKCDIWSLGVTIYELLFGRTPFTANSPKALLQKILQTKLTFPQNIKRSDQIKDLLVRMLKVRQEERISWNELFTHPVICPPEVVIDSSTTDSLIQSYRENEHYMKNNKVVSKTSTYSEQEEKKQEEHPKESTEVDFHDDLKAQEEKLSEYLKVDEIDELMRYKRNVSVFMNVQCNTFFSQLNEKIPDVYFYMGLYILLRHQIFIHKSLKAELSSGKPFENIGQVLWRQYLKSGAHSRITRLVECDLKHLSAYFKEVKTRMKKAVECSQVSEVIGIFEKYFMNEEQNFHQEPYIEIMDFLINMLRQLPLKDTNFMVKLKMTENPFKYFDKNLDFGLFYEHENEQLGTLREKHPELLVGQ